MTLEKVYGNAEGCNDPKSLVFPVSSIRRRSDEPDQLDIADVRGTAFYIGNSYYLTALHVVEAPTPGTELAICVGIEKDGLGVLKLDYWESFPTHDVALIHVIQEPADTPMPWTSTRLLMHTNTFTMGFAYALDLEARALTVRGFQGYVVSTRQRHDSPTKPWIYDLSFQCPRGLSGSPIFSYVDDSPCIAGMVRGNNITEMEVSSDWEETLEGERKQVYRRVEALHLGEALSVEEIAALHSERLGSSIGEYLTRTGLLGESVDGVSDG